MLKRIWCFLWGHKTLLKAFTGHAVEVTDSLTGGMRRVPTYVWEKQKYCVRCGKEVK